jgi:hypothetical protein
MYGNRLMKPIKILIHVWEQINEAYQNSSFKKRKEDKKE